MRMERHLVLVVLAIAIFTSLVDAKKEVKTKASEETKTEVKAKVPVMLVGGWDKDKSNPLMEPSFFSLNDATNPLPDCLKGTKNEIDGNDRRMPALIKTEGRSKNKVTILKDGFLKVLILDNKPVTCSGNKNGNCMIYDVGFPICSTNNFESHFKKFIIL